MYVTSSLFSIHDLTNHGATPLNAITFYDQYHAAAKFHILKLGLGSLHTYYKAVAFIMLFAERIQTKNYHHVCMTE